MEKIEIDNKEYLVELEWRMLDSFGKSTTKQAKDIAVGLSKSKEALNFKYAYIIESSANTVAGFSDVKQKAIPAAAYLAQANKIYNEKQGASAAAAIDWVLIEPVGDKYWLCAIKDGVPLPGLDVIGDYDDISDEIDQLISSETFVFYTSSDDVFKNIKDLAEVVEEKSFSELIEDVQIKSKFKKIKGINYFAIFLVLFLLILVFGGYLAYSSYEKAKLEDQQRIAAEKVRQQAKKQKETKLQAIKNYKIVVRDGFRNLNDNALSDATNGSNKQILGYWANIIGNTPTNHNGWELSNIECDLEYCTVNLSRTDLTNNRILKQIIDDIVINGQNAYYRIEVPSSEQQSISPQKVASDEDFLYDYISNFQNLSLSDSGVEYNIGQPEKVLYKLPKLDVTKGEMPDLDAVQSQEGANNRNSEATNINIDNGWFKGDVSFNGRFIEFMYDLNKYIPNNGFGVKSVSFSYPDLSWSLEAGYMIKEENPPNNPIDVYKQQLKEAGVDENDVQDGMPTIDPNITSVSSQKIDLNVSEKNNENVGDFTNIPEKNNENNDLKKMFE